MKTTSNCSHLPYEKRFRKSLERIIGELKQALRTIDDEIRRAERLDGATTRLRRQNRPNGNRCRASD